MKPAASSSLRRGLFTAEVSTAVLVFMVASTAILARILQAGVISSGFNEDVHIASSHRNWTTDGGHVRLP
jgi:hypothetical protein